MRLVRYNPWSLLNELQGELHSFVLPGAGAECAEVAHWTPALDIAEESSRFVIRSDLPGVDPEEIELTVDDGVLTLRGERSIERDNCSHAERARGAFCRSISLPPAADPEGIEASYDKGVLEIALHKREQAVSRKIRIEH